MAFIVVVSSIEILFIVNFFFFFIARYTNWNKLMDI